MVSESDLGNLDVDDTIQMEDGDYRKVKRVSRAINSFGKREIALKFYTTGETWYRYTSKGKGLEGALDIRRVVKTGRSAGDFDFDLITTEDTDMSNFSNKAFNTNAIMNKFFKPVNNMVWDLMTGSTGFKMGANIVSVDSDGQVVHNTMDTFGMPIPGFAQAVAPTNIQVHDAILNDQGLLGWVTSIEDGKFTLIKPDGTFGAWQPPKTTMLTFDMGVMVVRSLMNMLPDNKFGNFQSMLMPLALMGGGEEMGEMLPMMLMMQTGALGGQAGNMDMSGMMQMMMMMKMMKGSF